MSDQTPRFALPFIAPGQAQKELSHNEALARLDIALHAVVQTIGDDTPPAAPGLGQCWIVGAAPTGDWAGQVLALATWTDGGWRFVAPQPGMTAWLPSASLEARFDGIGWVLGAVPAAQLVIGGVQVVGTRQPAIAPPSGGSVMDNEARAAIASVIATLLTHGLIDA